MNNDCYKIKKLLFRLSDTHFKPNFSTENHVKNEKRKAIGLCCKDTLLSRKKGKLLDT